MVNRILTSLNHWLLPGRCEFCALPSSRDLDCCAECEDELPRPAAACPRCALPLPDGDVGDCGQCQRRPPAFSRSICAFSYAPPVSEVIANFKYHRGFAGGLVLGQLLAQRLQALPTAALPDALIPVPMHWRRRWRRGYNQAELITERLSRELALPVLRRTVVRHRATAAQQSLSARERRRNLRNAFTLKAPVTDLKLALVDDVVTTGSTTETISRLLLDAGAAEIQVWALARTAT